MEPQIGAIVPDKWGNVFVITLFGRVITPFLLPRGNVVILGRAGRRQVEHLVERSVSCGVAGRSFGACDSPHL